MTNRPIKKWKSGALSIAIFENEREVDGNVVGFKTVSFTRNWRKKGEDMWRSDVMNLRRADLPKAILLLQKAQEELLLEQREHQPSEEEGVADD